MDYCDWFRHMKRVTVRDELVSDLAKSNGRFEATLAVGDRIVTDAVVCAPGIRHYTNLPDSATSLPRG